MGRFFGLGSFTYRGEIICETRCKISSVFELGPVECVSGRRENYTWGRNTSTGRSEGVGGKTMLDVSLCIPNWSAVAVIGVDTGTLTVLGFTYDLWLEFSVSGTGFLGLLLWQANNCLDGHSISNLCFVF